MSDDQEARDIFSFDKDCRAKHHVLVSKITWDSMKTGQQIRRLIRCWFGRSHLLAMTSTPPGSEVKLGKLSELAATAGFKSTEEAEAAFRKWKDGQTTTQLGMAMIGPFGSKEIDPADLPPEVRDALKEIVSSITGADFDLDITVDEEGSSFPRVEMPNEARAAMEKILHDFTDAHAHEFGDDSPEDDEGDSDE